MPDSNRLQGNRSGSAAAASTVVGAIGESPPPPSSSSTASATSKLGQEDAASAGGKTSHFLLLTTTRGHRRSKRAVAPLVLHPASGGTIANPPNPVNVRSRSSNSRSSVDVVRVLAGVGDDVDDDADVAVPSPESVHEDFQEESSSTITYPNPINDGGSIRSSINTGGGINPFALLVEDEDDKREAVKEPPQPPETLLSAAAEAVAFDPDDAAAPLNDDLIDLFSHEGFIPVSASVVSVPTHNDARETPPPLPPTEHGHKHSSATLQFDKYSSSSSPESPPPPSDIDSKATTSFAIMPSNHITPEDSPVPDYVDDEEYNNGNDDNVIASTLPNDPLRRREMSPPPTQPTNLLFNNGGPGDELVPLLSPFTVDPTNHINALLVTDSVSSAGYLEGISIGTTVDDDVDYYFDDTIDSANNRLPPAQPMDRLVVVNEKESLLMQQKQKTQQQKEKENLPAPAPAPRQQRHNQRQPQLPSDVVNAKPASVASSSTAAGAVGGGGRRKKSANPDSSGNGGTMKNEPVKLTVPVEENPIAGGSSSGDGSSSFYSGDGVGSGYYWSSYDDLLRSGDDDDAMMRYNYDNNRIETEGLSRDDVLARDKGGHPNDDIDIRPLDQQQQSNYIDNPFSYNVVVGQEDSSLSLDNDDEVVVVDNDNDVDDDFANNHVDDDALHVPVDAVSVTNNNHQHQDLLPVASTTNKSGGRRDDLWLHGSPKAPPTIDHNKHNANDKGSSDNNKAGGASLPHRILVNVSIATDSGTGTQNHAIYMLQVSLPAGPDLRTFDNYNQSHNPYPYPIPIHVPVSNPSPSPVPVTVPVTPMPLSPTTCPSCAPCGGGGGGGDQGPTNGRAAAAVSTVASQLNSTIIEHANDGGGVEGTTITNELTTSSEIRGTLSTEEGSTTTSTEGETEQDQTDRTTDDYDNLATSTMTPISGGGGICSNQCPDIPILILEGERVSSVVVRVNRHVI